MRLNSIKPAAGSKQNSKRVGRGIGCGSGKTCGRGHKGQRSRSGGYHKVGFEGGQMPIQKRLPKVGFSSRVSTTAAKVRLCDLAQVTAEVVDLESLKAVGVVKKNVKTVKIYLSGTVASAITVKGLAVSKGAKEAIEAAGGKVEE